MNLPRVPVFMYYEYGRYKMQEFVSFFKNIFMMEDNTKVGLSQFKAAPPAKRAKQKAAENTEVKLSDLMRGYN
jgi:hypothetical protein